MPSIYDFSDYQSFFSIYLTWLKQHQRNFSLRWLAHRLNLKSHSILIGIANGNKFPSAELLAKINNFMQLSADEATFALELSGFSSAASTAEKEYFLDRIEKIRLKIPNRRLNLEETSVFEDWYHLAIFELIGIPGFKNERGWLQARLGSLVSEEHIAAAIENLCRLNFISLQPDGSFRKEVSSFTSSHNIPSPAIRRFHSQLLGIAKVSLESQLVTERTFFSQTMAFDIERMEEAQTLLIEFRTKFQKLMEGGNPKEVYHLALQLFPLTTAVSKSSGYLEE